MAFLKLTDITQVHDPGLYLAEVGGWNSSGRAEELGWWIKKKTKQAGGGRGILSANQRRNQIKRMKSKKNTALLFWGHRCWLGGFIE